MKRYKLTTIRISKKIDNTELEKDYLKIYNEIAARNDKFLQKIREDVDRQRIEQAELRNPIKRLLKKLKR